MIMGELSFTELGQTFLKLAISFILATIIGIERERSKQVAGLRTHILICVGATLLMILSIYVPAHFGSGISDPSRIAAQVVSGIGFLGAGAILRYGFNIKGLTTAANIWVMAAIGLTVGAGMYYTAIFSSLLILFTLTVINKLEKKLFPSNHTKIIQIKFNQVTLSFNDLREIIKKHTRIRNYEVFKSGENEEISSKFLVQLKEDEVEQLLKEAKKEKGISEIKITDEF